MVGVASELLVVAAASITIFMAAGAVLTQLVVLAGGGIGLAIARLECSRPARVAAVRTRARTHTQRCICAVYVPQAVFLDVADLVVAYDARDDANDLARGAEVGLLDHDEVAALDPDLLGVARRERGEYTLAALELDLEYVAATRFDHASNTQRLGRQRRGREHVVRYVLALAAHGRQGLLGDGRWFVGSLEQWR